MTPSEALRHIRTLVEASADLKDDTQRKALLRSVVVVAQKRIRRGTGWRGRVRAQHPDVSYAVVVAATMFGHQ